MNRDEIIRMAREAGLFVPQAGIPDGGALMRFVAAVEAAEREACAKVCLDAGLSCEVRQGADLCFELSEAIRARGQA